MGGAEDVDARIESIEAERRASFLRMRALVLGVVVLVTLWNVAQNACALLGLVDEGVGYWMSAASVVVGVLNTAFEVVVRWRMPLLEGRSEHLIGIKERIDALRPTLLRYRELRRGGSCAPSTEVEGAALEACLDELCAELTYEASMRRVLARAPAPGSDPQNGASA